MRASYSFFLRAKRERVYYERGGKCEECHKKLPLREIQLHHIRPRSEMGGDQDKNLIFLCDDCHKSKHPR